MDPPTETSSNYLVIVAVLILLGILYHNHGMPMPRYMLELFTLFFFILDTIVLSHHHHQQHLEYPAVWQAIVVLEVD